MSTAPSLSCGSENSRTTGLAPRSVMTAASTGFSFSLIDALRRYRATSTRGRRVQQLRELRRRGDMGEKAAVHRPELPGDPGRTVGGQESDHFRDVLRLAQPPGKLV